MTRHTIREELRSVLLFIGVIWAVFLVGLVLPQDINAWGLYPRSLRGIVGIVLSPFLHSDLTHLLGNTIPLFVLLVLLAGSRANSWAIVGSIVLLGGCLLWLFGRPMIHVGASGLIYGLIAFLVVSGLIERRPVSLAIAVLVGFLYGGTFFSGILPSLGSQVSWDGHLLGGIAGGLVASVLTSRNPW